MKDKSIWSGLDVWSSFAMANFFLSYLTCLTGGNPGANLCLAGFFVCGFLAKRMTD